MVDLVKAKRAIEQVETNGGENNCPRFERAYMPAGMSFTIQGHIVTGTGTAFNAIVKERWDKWGLSSAASYGPAQLLYQTAADLGLMAHPAILWEQPSWHDYYVNLRLDRIIKKGAATIEQVADAWNSGSFSDSIIPAEYIARVKAAYDAL
jgi:hypothetical protein